jgi:hypothetical protein
MPRKVAQNKGGKGRGKGRGKGSNKSSAPPKTVNPPDNAAAINVENRLHILPNILQDYHLRPWFQYDYVDPAPKYRRMEDLPHPDDPSDVSEGEYSEDISDDPEGAVPVEIPGYE